MMKLGKSDPRIEKHPYDDGASERVLLHPKRSIASRFRSAIKKATGMSVSGCRCFWFSGPLRAAVRELFCRAGKVVPDLRSVEMEHSTIQPEVTELSDAELEAIARGDFELDEAGRCVVGSKAVVVSAASQAEP